MTTREVRKLSKTVRQAANVRGTAYPIKVVDGFSGSELVGRSYGWKSKTGIWWRGPFCRSGPRLTTTFRRRGGSKSGPAG